MPMTAKKATKRIAQRGSGRWTKKRTGYIVTSLRLLAKENRELRKYALTQGISFNSWALNTLLTEARKGSKTNGETNPEA
jgi:hypothetical protein